MREILFRGKRVDNGEWIYGHFVKDDGECFIVKMGEMFSITIPSFLYKVAPETVGQYTGFKDRNDKKIFEGDIVRLMFGIREIKDIYTVSFVNDRGGWFPFANGDGCGCCEDATYPPSDEGVCYDFIVIGNMHDNPELV